MTVLNELQAASGFTVACHLCNAKFDATAAAWCRCGGRLRTLICPHCSNCFCRATPHYRKTFWEKAPRSLRENTNRFRIGDGPVAGGEQEDEVAENPAPPRVLIVDDVEDMRSLVACYVEQMGYAVTTAAGPGEALEILASGTRIDVLLTDALMPGMDGRELCQKVKAEYGDAVKLIVMTSLYTANRYRTEARYRFGVDEYLAKPLHISVLKAALDRVCPVLQPAA